MDYFDLYELTEPRPLTAIHSIALTQASNELLLSLDERLTCLYSANTSAFEQTYCYQPTISEVLLSATIDASHGSHGLGPPGPPPSHPPPPPPPNSASLTSHSATDDGDFVEFEDAPRLVDFQALMCEGLDEQYGYSNRFADRGPEGTVNPALTCQNFPLYPAPDNPGMLHEEVHADEDADSDMSDLAPPRETAGDITECLNRCHYMGYDRLNSSTTVITTISSRSDCTEPLPQLTTVGHVPAAKGKAAAPPLTSPAKWPPYQQEIIFVNIPHRPNPSSPTSDSSLSTLVSCPNTMSSPPSTPASSLRNSTSPNSGKTYISLPPASSHRSLCGIGEVASMTRKSKFGVSNALAAPRRSSSVSSPSSPSTESASHSPRMTSLKLGRSHPIAAAPTAQLPYAASVQTPLRAAAIQAHHQLIKLRGEHVEDFNQHASAWKQGRKRQREDEDSNAELDSDHVIIGHPKAPKPSKPRAKAATKQEDNTSYHLRSCSSSASYSSSPDRSLDWMDEDGELDNEEKYHQHRSPQSNLHRPAKRRKVHADDRLHDANSDYSSGEASSTDMELKGPWKCRDQIWELVSETQWKRMKAAEKKRVHSVESIENGKTVECRIIQVDICAAGRFKRQAELERHRRDHIQRLTDGTFYFPGHVCGICGQKQTSFRMDNFSRHQEKPSCKKLWETLPKGSFMRRKFVVKNMPIRRRRELNVGNISMDGDDFVMDD